MLQLRALNDEIIDTILREGAPADETLEERADRVIARLREERVRHAGQHGLLTRALVRLDGLLRTDAPEFLDRADYAAAGKVRIVARLDRLNRALLAYRRFLAVLRPYVERVHHRERRTVRILELASGSGEFTLALAQQARQQRLPVAITGSDYLDAHVAEGNAKARSRGLEVAFRNINAFDMHNVRDGEFDLVFVAQTMHHFTPGQLAMMVEQAGRKAAHAFIGIDVQRSLHIYAALPAIALLNPDYGFLHDSIISIRKMYSEPELELIAKLAVPHECVRTYRALPGYSVLEVLRPCCIEETGLGI